MKKSLFALPLLLMATSASANPATIEGATHLLAVFQTYLGTTAGVVKVTANGDSYALTLDAAPLMALAAQSGGSATLTPLTMTLTDNGDGTWGVTQDQAVALAFAMPGAADVAESIGSLKSTGVFDEKLLSFTSLTGTMTDLKVSEKITQAGQGAMSVDVSLASMTFQSTGAADPAGGVTNDFTMTAKGLSETILSPATATTPAVPISVTADSEDATGKMTGLRPDAFYQTLAWFVAHPSKDAMQADKAGLKTILTAGMPFFATASMTATVRKLSVATPVGPVAIDEMAVALEANGLVPDGKFREAFSLSGLTLPDGLLPFWATPLLPQKLSLDVQVTDFDAAAAATVGLGVFDLPTGTPPDAVFQAKMLAALLPKGTVTITLNPGAVSGDGYALTYQGAMVAGPGMPVPTGTARITLTGIDRLQAALAAAPESLKGQAQMAIAMAQGMAKPGDNGELVWEIDAAKPGSVLINGANVLGGN